MVSEYFCNVMQGADTDNIANQVSSDVYVFLFIVVLFIFQGP